MATPLEQEQARKLLQLHGNRLPASLRDPLRAVRDSREVPATAEDVLRIAEDLLRKENQS